MYTYVFILLNSNAMETKSLTILINECVILMRGVGYSEKSIRDASKFRTLS